MVLIDYDDDGDDDGDDCCVDGGDGNDKDDEDVDFVFNFV